MSGSVTNFAGTLTGGIQDISALLPLIGTEQCENHVGSALEGGFLYAIATPLSLFGSLGIVRAGISVLVASISIPKPSLTFTPLPKLSFTSSRRLLCGARVLDNAGFKLVGSVAPLIGMDAKCYKAESRLIEILEEKHIDTPEKLSIDWRSAEWNISLVIGTIVAALISGTPYLYLLLKDPPNSIHSPWVFPFLRTVGSCLATVCCQFLLQSRVISLMKSRIVFMIVHRVLIDDLKKGKGDQAESILKELQKQIRWDESFPAEECLWSLEQYLLSRLPSARDKCTFRQYMRLLKRRFRGLIHSLLSKVRIPKAKDVETNHPGNSDNDSEGRGNVQPIPPEPFSDPNHILSALMKQRTEHFPTPRPHRISIMISWFLLLVSLPAAVAGYIGCFTLVTNSQLSSSGPLGWLGLEAALSALRILLWAWNPSFDEKTGVDVQLKLTREQPLVTTQWDLDVLQSFQWPLLPERRFLEQITPYTGPLVQFKSPDNTALYFVFAANKKHTERRLFMTVLDLTNRVAFTLYISEDTSSQVLVYANTFVTPDTNSGEMLASIRWDSAVDVDHPRRINIPIYDLAKYYDSLLHSLTRSKFVGSAAVSLPWGWGLVAKESEDEIQGQERKAYTSANLTEHEHLCLYQSDEHHLKTGLMKIWGKWIVDGVEAMYRDGRNDCHLALVDPTSNEAKQKLYAFNVVLVREWTKRELAQLQLSAALESVFRAHVTRNAEKLVGAKQKMSFSLEWSSDLQRQRLDSERAQVKVRREDMMKTVEQNGFASIWQAGQTFVEEKWTAAIERGLFEEGSTGFPETTTEHEWFGESDDEMRALVEQLKPRFSHWNDQHDHERREMEATLGRIRKANAKQLKQAYKYPESSARLAARIHSKFVCPSFSAFVAKVSSATVYDVIGISTIDVIRTVAEKSSCRSLINVLSYLIPHIPDNDHLLFCSDPFNKELNLPFIQRNRNRWWEQRNTNSWTFYLSPQWVGDDSQYVYSCYGTIAHIMIFLQTPTHLRLHLLHCRNKDMQLSIQEEGKELLLVHPAEISRDEPRLQDYDLDHRFEPGRHKLQLVVVVQDPDPFHRYYLRDIVVEFVDDPSSGTITSNLT